MLSKEKHKHQASEKDFIYKDLLPSEHARAMVAQKLVEVTNQCLFCLDSSSTRWSSILTDFKWPRTWDQVAQEPMENQILLI